jgi:hypothetical protein
VCAIREAASAAQQLATAAFECEKLCTNLLREGEMSVAIKGCLLFTIAQIMHALYCFAFWLEKISCYTPWFVNSPRLLSTLSPKLQCPWRVIVLIIPEHF